MARAATTSDAYNAVAEPRRRQILDLLAGGELPVGELADRLGLAQPLVSKHLRVLREVGLVQVRDEGRQRLYRLDARPLRDISDWLRTFERAVSERFDLMDDVIQELKAQEADHGDHDQLGEGDDADRHPAPHHP
jgi:DNA-binding transcriptional ArsR family regulator